MTTVEQVENNVESGLVEDVRRRDFIHIAAISFAGVGAGAVALPLVSQMGASADVLAQALGQLMGDLLERFVAQFTHR